MISSCIKWGLDGEIITRPIYQLYIIQLTSWEYILSQLFEGVMLLPHGPFKVGLIIKTFEGAYLSLQPGGDKNLMCPCDTKAERTPDKRKERSTY